jgi:hypothetical protein
MKEILADYIFGMAVVFRFITLSAHINIKMCNNNYPPCVQFYYSRDRMNETGEECGTYGRQKRCIQNFGGEI